MDDYYFKMDYDACAFGPLTKRRINKAWNVGYAAIDQFDCKFGEICFKGYDIEFGVSKNVEPSSKKVWKMNKQREHAG